MSTLNKKVFLPLNVLEANRTKSIKELAIEETKNELYQTGDVIGIDVVSVYNEMLNPKQHVTVELRIQFEPYKLSRLKPKKLEEKSWYIADRKGLLKR